MIRTAEPASPSEERLKLLASWAATTAATATDAASAPASEPARAASVVADRQRDR